MVASMAASGAASSPMSLTAMLRKVQLVLRYRFAVMGGRGSGWTIVLVADPDDPCSPRLGCAVVLAPLKTLVEEPRDHLLL